MRSRPFSLSALVVALLVSGVGLSGCAAPSDSASGQSPSASVEAGTRVVKTDQGDVTIPAKPKKVVLLNYALAGYLYDLDAPVAGVTSEATNTDASYSEFWEKDARAQGTEFVSWSPEGFDLQEILAMKPDLIIAGGLGYPLMLATKQYKQLSEIAPTVIVSGKLTEWQQQYEFLAGDVFGKPKVYQDALARYEAKAKKVRDSIAPPAGESVFLSFTADQRPYVLIEDRGLPRVFSDLGFRPAPLFATGDFKPYTAGGDSFEISTEQAGQLLTQESVFVFGFNAETVDLKTLRGNPVYAALPAFTKNQAYQFPYWAQRADFDESMALLDLIQKQFAK
ncbi:ferric enterobactin (enterochelin)-binding protein [Leucobacter sp. OLJS4]|uniref:ABC transporter substrate-binding protein n=1 Tax=unclassified Leucobacter TaxID=2621730 RepID=UPI000C1985AC|nr:MULTISPECIES: ABC transporter substrate-binding protein [unclassified Leucobacter]PIJ31944.1 ferric enterobactin (enterochelin)-binding protein [Leucobacter sp. OLES1]PII87899.1 ferric enterobactin (enterochelin)-binding protein [Leucobacter sp. OLCALW19]PII92883.1 ferric enterobactin (enterochelin)-binding protein [Leucobacter sp. OLAS13]PII96369.1 ferric enterobactin (enterochelin)-binding protein [Leucobacter sp. OLTLW20]PII97592.1 ferric enterobactin (enterochelin)-binding protein [Leuc